MRKAEIVKTMRRQQLIAATIRAIGRFGYANTTLTHVAGEAGLSPGICNFYFKSKEQLLIATLEQIAEEYQAFWQAAIDKGKISPAEGLAAMIEADFHPTVCNVEKVSIWYAFWAEARNNAAYRALVQRLEADYLQQTENLCARLIQSGGYEDLEAAAIAAGLNAMIDGLWFDCLIEPEVFERETAKQSCYLFLAAIFPGHFAGRRRSGKSGAGETRNLPLALDQDTRGRDAHRARLAAALRQRLEPQGKLRREILAAAIGVSPKILESWLEGRAEPSSFQMGRLIVATDAALWIDVYGPVHDEARRLFTARLAEHQEQAAREGAALAALARP